MVSQASIERPNSEFETHRQTWTTDLHARPQDYLVVPEQP